MNDPIELLKIEHLNIIRGLNLLTTTGKIFEDGTTPTHEINELIKFFRLYADDAHHAKEEAILFPRFILKNPSFSSETSPISVLIDHHFLGRKIVANISKLDNQFPFHVNDYNELLQRHIEIEDELFPQLAEENFDAKEINDIAEEFSKADEIRNLDELLKILDRVEINIM